MPTDPRRCSMWFLFFLLLPVSSFAQVPSSSAPNTITLWDMGGGIKSYSDSQGNMGTIQSFGGGLESYMIQTPNGQLQTGTIYSPPPIQPIQQMRPSQPMVPMNSSPCFQNQRALGRC